jgi:hypothetical protein
MPETDVKVTSRCPLCHAPTHLWQDNSGSGWMHDRLADEWACWREHRAELEQATA